MTDSPIARLRAQHEHSDGGEWCSADGDDWPCTTIAALDALERARNKGAALYVRYARHLDDCSAYRPFPTGSPSPCSCGFEAAGGNETTMPEEEWLEWLRFRNTMFDRVAALEEGIESARRHMYALNKAVADERDKTRSLQARIDAATVLIRQAMHERHMHWGTSDIRHCGAPLGTSIDTCPNCAPYRAWLASDKDGKEL